MQTMGVLSSTEEGCVIISKRRICYHQQKKDVIIRKRMMLHNIIFPSPQYTQDVNLHLDYHLKHQKKKDVLLSARKGCYIMLYFHHHNTHKMSTYIWTII